MDPEIRSELHQIVDLLDSLGNELRPLLTAKTQGVHT